MISVYSGRPGAGKSYAAVVQVIAGLLKGRRVVTNLPLNPRAIDLWVRRRRKPPRRLPPSRARSWRIRRYLLARLWRGESGRADCWFAPSLQQRGQLAVVDSRFFESGDNWRVAFIGVRQLFAEDAAAAAGEDPPPVTASTGAVVVVDECGAVLDKYVVGDKSKRNMAALMQALQEHRHYYASVILIVQSHHQLDSAKRIKALVGRWCEVANLRHAVGVGAYVRNTYESHYGADRLCLSTVRGNYKQEIFNLYRSHAAAAGWVDESGIEQDVAAGGTAKTKLIIYISFVCVAAVAAVWLALSASEGMFGDLLGGQSIESTVQESPRTPAVAAATDAAAPALSPPPESLPPSQRWPLLEWRPLDYYSESTNIATLDGGLLRVGDSCGVEVFEGVAWLGCKP